MDSRVGPKFFKLSNEPLAALIPARTNAHSYSHTTGIGQSIYPICLEKRLKEVVDSADNIAA